MVSLRISNLKICIFKLCLCVWGGMGWLGGGSRYMYAQAPSEGRSIGSSWSYSRWLLVVTVGAGKQTAVLGQSSAFSTTEPSDELTEPWALHASSSCTSPGLFRTQRGSVNCNRQTLAICCIFPDSLMFACPDEDEEKTGFPRTRHFSVTMNKVLTGFSDSGSRDSEQAHLVLFGSLALFFVF